MFMTMSSATPDLESRLVKLERQNRRLMGLVGLLFMMMVVVIVWRSLPGEKKVVARSFEVHDAHGQTRAELGLAPDGGPWVRLNNPAGKARAMMYMPPREGPTVRLTDESGRNRATWSLGADGTPHLVMLGDDGRSRVVIEITPDNRAILVTRDAQLETLWAAPDRAP
jgi:hypothetical protein